MAYISLTSLHLYALQHLVPTTPVNISVYLPQQTSHSVFVRLDTH